MIEGRVRYASAKEEGRSKAAFSKAIGRLTNQLAIGKVMNLTVSHFLPLTLITVIVSVPVNSTPVSVTPRSVSSAVPG